MQDPYDKLQADTQGHEIVIPSQEQSSVQIPILATCWMKRELSRCVLIDMLFYTIRTSLAR